jgi:chromosome segregation ATPase
MSSKRTDAMVTTRRTDADARAERVRAVLAQMVAVGEVWDLSTVAAKASVSRGLIYRRLELRADFDATVEKVQADFARGLSASAQVSAASLRADLENSRAQVRRLQTQVSALESRVGDRIAQDVNEELAAGGDVARLREEIIQLETALNAARTALADRDEELAAARQVNRELMTKLNKPQPRLG